MTLEELIKAAAVDVETQFGGAKARSLAQSIEVTAIGTLAKAIEIVIGGVPVVGPPASAVTTPLIEALAARLEALVDAKVDAKLAALGSTGKVEATGLGPAAG